MKCFVTVLALFVISIIPPEINADLVFSSNFTAAEGFADGQLRNNANWFGQGTWNVDSGAGTVAGTAGTFGRIANNNGALATLGNATFTTGDRLVYSTNFSFSLGGPTNTFNIMQGGMTSATSGTPNVEMGFKLQYNQFRGGTGTGPGSLKLYGNLGDSANEFALIVDADQFGMDPFGTSGPADLDSDNIDLTWEVTKTANADEWSLTNLSLDGNTFSGSPVTFTFSGAEAFFNIQATNQSNATAFTMNSASFNVFTAVPEPTSIAMFGIAGLLMCPRRRKN